MSELTYDEYFKEQQKELELAQEILKDSKLVKIEKCPGYAHTKYMLVYSPIPERVSELTAHHGALIADGCLLPFGGHGYMMQQIGDKIIFTGIYHTD